MSSLYLYEDANLKDVGGDMVDGDNIYIKDGATLTITETHHVLIDTMDITDGVVFVDGLNISANNIINIIGEGGLLDSSNDKSMIIRGQGTIKTRGGWYSIGTTDGTVGQVIDFSTDTGSGMFSYDGVDHCIDTIPMIQVETGRKLNYTSGSGVAPKVGDMVYKTSDRLVMGKIHSVGTDYIVVWALTGSLVDTDDIVIRSVVDNVGPDLQRSWTATMNGDDVLASGVYMEFGNARSNGDDYASSFGNGYGGLVYNQTFGVPSLTIGEGFLPPSGCDIRVPNINVTTSSLDNDAGDRNPYANHEAFGPATNSNKTHWWWMELSAGGTIDLHTTNFGGATCSDATAYSYRAEYVGTTTGLGSQICASRSYFNHCVGVQTSELYAAPTMNNFASVQDLVNGADVEFCMSLNARNARQSFGGTTSLNVNIKDCIYTSAGQGDNIASSSAVGYLYSKVSGGSMDNCMYFGSLSSEQDSAVYLTNSPNISITDFMFSGTQDYSPHSLEINSIGLSASSNASIIGVEVFGDGVFGNYMIGVVDQDGLKVRAIGMIDDKVDMGTDGEYLVGLVGLCNNIDVARCWKTNGAHEEVILTNTTSKNISVANCSGKYLSGIYPAGGDNVRFKGIHGGSGDIGNGTEGVEDSYIASYGNSFHDHFYSDTNGNIILTMINPSDNYNESTITGGNPKFFKDGDLDMTEDDDEIIFEMGYFTKGHTGFTGNITSVIGTADWYANEWNKLDIYFQWQVEGGSWNGTWLDMRTDSNLTDLNSEDLVSGMKLKIKLVVQEGSGGKANMSLLMIETTTTLQDQKDNMYPIDQFEATLTLTGIKDGSDVVILQAGTNTVLKDVDQGGTTFTYTYSTLQDIDIGVIKQGFITLYQYGYTLGDTDAVLPINQLQDRAYD